MRSGQWQQSHNPAGGRGTVMLRNELCPGGLLQSVDSHPAIKALKDE
ncbi:hypothetical protein ACLBOM_32750 [Escherichia coli]